ncbi:hypothetical protein H4R99_001202 [Coemansia sp. RSA 1722]|nr:hypothetical protein LPJ57_000514 [Coemansia sp. RSA 486]KAJ2237244.1 hypothetical protein IWW45_001119 [Coemansia sp. RSA 485]KAJ2601409.1 hypothetical protein GGF39_001256 [Coemansia sp. RSA 1721]KAJ2605343.1 hypothetical protein H4R99_001202 [Coemansia sp. RSA 1722]KAJ2638788.1 hypothetical protein GGF40_001386 [Coemansia sp. RSA 1286]
MQNSASRWVQLFLSLILYASLCSADALGADTYYDFMYSVTELRMFQGAGVKPLWISPEANNKAQQLANVASALQADDMLEFPLSIDTATGTDAASYTVLYATGPDIASVARAWSEECSKCKDSLISAQFTVIGLANAGNYWTAYLAN